MEDGVMLQSTKKLRACLKCHLIKDQETVHFYLIWVEEREDLSKL